MEHTVVAGITLDGNGIALVLTAAAGGVVTIGTFVMQIITFLDNRKRGRERSVQLSEVKTLVNGKSEQLLQYAAQQAYEKGREHERVAPGTPSPTVSIRKVEEVTSEVAAPPKLPATPA